MIAIEAVEPSTLLLEEAPTVEAVARANLRPSSNPRARQRRRMEPASGSETVLIKADLGDSLTGVRSSARGLRCPCNSAG
jgi:hypothetical protein